MAPFLSKYSGPLYAAMRLVVGFLYFCHGAQKLLGLFGGMDVGGKPLFQAAGIIETVCGAMIALGLLTPYAALIASGEMAVAYFKFHFPGGIWPIMNHGELPALFCFVFLYFSAHGSGALSLDAALSKARK
ncbi:MAG: DoxX family protein [Gemmatimonadales bacterium]